MAKCPDPSSRAAFSYRDDPDVPAFDDAFWHVVMDDQCGLCARTARRIAHLDHLDRVRIVPLRSALGTGLMRHYGLDPSDPQSWLLIRHGTARAGFDAAMHLFPYISAFYTPLLMLKILPSTWREALYAWIARHRYAWFGRTDLCALPDPQVQARLITPSELTAQASRQKA